eukprot:gene2635-3187_t
MAVTKEESTVTESQGNTLEDGHVSEESRRDSISSGSNGGNHGHQAVKSPTPLSKAESEAKRVLAAQLLADAVNSSVKRGSGGPLNRQASKEAGLPRSLSNNPSFETVDLLAAPPSTATSSVVAKLSMDVMSSSSSNTIGSNLSAQIRRKHLKSLKRTSTALLALETLETGVVKAASPPSTSVTERVRSLLTPSNSLANSSKPVAGEPPAAGSNGVVAPADPEPAPAPALSPSENMKKVILDDIGAEIVVDGTSPGEESAEVLDFDVVAVVAKFLEHRAALNDFWRKKTTGVLERIPEIQFSAGCGPSDEVTAQVKSGDVGAHPHQVNADGTRIQTIDDLYKTAKAVRPIFQKVV